MGADMRGVSAVKAASGSGGRRRDEAGHERVPGLRREREVENGDTNG